MKKTLLVLTSICYMFSQGIMFDNSGFFISSGLGKSSDNLLLSNGANFSIGRVVEVGYHFSHTKKFGSRFDKLSNTYHLGLNLSKNIFLGTGFMDAYRVSSGAVPLFAAYQSIKENSYLFRIGLGTILYNRSKYSSPLLLNGSINVATLNSHFGSLIIAPSFSGSLSSSHKSAVSLSFGYFFKF